MQKFKSHPLFSNYVTVLTTLEAELYIKYQSRCVLQHWYPHYAIQSSNPFWTDMKVCSRCNRDGMYWPSLLFLLTGKFHSDAVTTRIYHTRGSGTATYFSTTLKFFLLLDSPRPSEMLEPLTHRSQRGARQGERSRGWWKSRNNTEAQSRGREAEDLSWISAAFWRAFPTRWLHTLFCFSIIHKWFHIYSAFLCILVGTSLHRCVFYKSLHIHIFSLGNLGDGAYPQVLTPWMSHWNFKYNENTV